MKIGIDIMGGDFAPQAPLDGVKLALNDLPGDVQIVLFGDESVIHATLIPNDHSHLEVVHAPDRVLMSDHPTRVLSSKPQSSLIKGVLALKAGNIDGFCSAGNTGAMLVACMYTVNAIPGVIRPCITSILPGIHGNTGIILDVGANADCKPDVLYQFAVLGSIYAKEVLGIDNPRVGLLNIGEEPEKGNLLAQATHQMMKDSSDFNFIGNVEGRDLFIEKADVIVCDGFTGNVVLKEAESMFTILRKKGIQDEFLNRFNYELYGGTPILGINSNVVIGHGISTPLAIRNMINHTIDVTRAKLPSRLENAFKK